VFRISEAQLDGGCRELRVEGELDLVVVGQLQARLEKAIDDEVEVLIRLDRCDFIDSTGIAAILIAHKELTRKGRRLAICDPSAPVARTLEITGLGLDGLLYPGAEAAPAGAPPAR
jgi:anti-anti-sigma factor